VKAQIKRVEENVGIKEAEKKELIGLYHQALEQIQRAERGLTRIADYEKEKQAAPTLIAEIKEKLAALAVKHAPPLPTKGTLADLEQRLGQAQAALASTQKELQELEADIRFTPTRRMELPKRVEEARGQLEEVQKQQKAEMTAGEALEMRIARRTLLRAQMKAAQTTLEAREKEIQTFEVRKELHRFKRDLATREIKEREKQVAAWQDVVNTRRQAEAAKGVEEAKRKLAEASPAVKKLARINAEIAEERGGREGPAKRIGPVEKETDRIKDLLKIVSDRSNDVEKKVKMVGLTNSISLLLRKERINLPDTRLHTRNVKLRQKEIGIVLSRLIQLEEDLEWYRDTEGRIVEIMGELGSGIRPDQRLEVQDAVREALKTLCANHEGLIKDYDKYFMDLVNLNTTESELVNKTTRFAKYIDENVFWFPSTGALSASSVTEAGKAFMRLFDPSSWSQVFRTLGLDIRANLFLNGMVFIFLAGVLLVKHKHWLGSLAARDEDSFAHTLRMLIETLLVALLWPAVMLYLVWRLTSWPESTNFAKEIAAGLFATAIIFLTMEVFLKLCLPKGVAERHFKWSPSNSKIIRHNLYWLMAVGLPMVFIFSALDWEQDEPGKASLGRIAFIVLLAGFALFLQRVLGPIRLALHRSMASRWEGWGTWTHYIWFPLAMGIPVVLAAMAAVGYYYTAMELSWRLLATLWLLLGMMIAREMLLRWLFITNRKLAMGKGTTVPSPGGVESKTAGEDTGLNIFTISDQTRKLLDSFVVLILAVGLWQIWEQVIPAMGKLRQVDLTIFKLSDLLLGIVVFFMTFIAAKNIPGLLEITILPRLPLDSGLRFAITRVTRYLITVVGSAIGLWIFGVEWKDLQWLIAAMTVGLSFGLQEIFANFVSGLIILFERPMRVGDIVTVGDVSGTVTKIQIRATTITDHDRKELIVPNKEFITGRVVNWTLSDRVLRLVIPVGIGYGSDTDLAQKLLLKAATDNPKVLEKPAPSAAFLGFGESAINFELGVFTTVENFGILRHELNTAINHAFRDAGIQIPFPQQEIHVRSITENLMSPGGKKPEIKIVPETDKNWPKIS
jgi:potassium efflux system protein